MFKRFSPSAEPVAWLAAATDVVAAAAYFGHLAPEGAALLTAAVVSVLAIFTRRSVTPA